MFLLFVLAEVLIVSSAPHFGYPDAAMLASGFFQGDIAEFDPSFLSDRGAIVNLKNLWPNGVMYYKIDKSLDFIESGILSAMEEYENKTCVRFRRATSENPDYVNIAFMNGCWSALGRKGGEQEISLGAGCHDKGTILHEIGHALGFIHEQSRSDRDEYVNIIWSNIEEGEEDQFSKMKYYDNNLLEETFDYESIMLYGEYTFSKDGKSPTILAKDPDIFIGPVDEKHFLSKSDINRVNKLYQCFGMKRPKPPQAPDIVCDLEDGDCGVVNEFGSSSFKRRFVKLGGRTSTVYLVDAANDDDDDPLFGLKTPLYHLYGSKEGCFSFDFYFNGKDFYNMNVYKGLEKLFESKEKSDTWKTFSTTVTEEEGDVKFYIGGTILGSGRSQGIFAVDNLAFRLSPCVLNRF